MLRRQAAMLELDGDHATARQLLAQARRLVCVQVVAASGRHGVDEVIRL
ncbi:hypothetical protein [Azospirillum sp. TSO35-2]|nr:hypothetical protein [Azospirillum sp. TSO35-2]